MDKTQLAFTAHQLQVLNQLNQFPTNKAMVVHQLDQDGLPGQRLLTSLDQLIITSSDQLETSSYFKLF